MTSIVSLTKATKNCSKNYLMHATPNLDMPSRQTKFWLYVSDPWEGKRYCASRAWHSRHPVYLVGSLCWSVRCNTGLSLSARARIFWCENLAVCSRWRRFRFWYRMDVPQSLRSTSHRWAIEGESRWMKTAPSVVAIHVLIKENRQTTLAICYQKRKPQHRRCSPTQLKRLREKGSALKVVFMESWRMAYSLTITSLVPRWLKAKFRRQFHAWLGPDFWLQSGKPR